MTVDRDELRRQYEIYRRPVYDRLAMDEARTRLAAATPALLDEVERGEAWEDVARQLHGVVEQRDQRIADLEASAARWEESARKQAHHAVMAEELRVRVVALEAGLREALLHFDLTPDLEEPHDRLHALLGGTR